MTIDITNISLPEWCLGGALLLCFLYELYFYIRYMGGILRRMRRDRREKARSEEATGNEAAPVQPGVTVVVCARNESDNLQAYLQALVSQRYPEYEVIVVNDASQDDTQLVLDRFTQIYPNLRLTFVPQEAWVRSSKKLALTLAAKAARYDYLLLTDADCRPESPYWIAEMMRGFQKEGVEVVLGYGAYFLSEERVNRLIQYDTIWNAMLFLGSALSRHPYMGVGRNLAYSKETFFRNHGFSGLLGEKAGDDDLLINKIAHRRNTAVVLTPGSFTWSVPKTTFAEWKMQKYRHLSVSPAYKESTKWRLAIEPAVRGLFYSLTLAVIVLGVTGIATSWLLWALTALLFVVRHVLISAMVSRTARALGSKRFTAGEVLRYDIFLPLNNLFMLLKHKRHRREEMKW